MIRINRLNENKLEIEDLIILFAELSDDDLITNHRTGDTISGSRNIAITIGEYFRSNPFLLKDILNKENENREKVISYLESKKTFEINIQIDTDDKLKDMIKVLEFLENNKDQIKYFGYEFQDFYLSKNRTFNEWSSNLLTVKYKSV